MCQQMKTKQKAQTNHIKIFNDITAVSRKLLEKGKGVDCGGIFMQYTEPSPVEH